MTLKPTKGKEMRYRHSAAQHKKRKIAKKEERKEKREKRKTLR